MSKKGRRRDSLAMIEEPGKSLHRRKVEIFWRTSMYATEFSSPDGQALRTALRETVKARHPHLRVVIRRYIAIEDEAFPGDMVFARFLPHEQGFDSVGSIVLCTPRNRIRLAQGLPSLPPHARQGLLQRGWKRPGASFYWTKEYTVRQRPSVAPIAEEMIRSSFELTREETYSQMLLLEGWDVSKVALGLPSGAWPGDRAVDSLDVMRRLFGWTVMPDDDE